MTCSLPARAHVRTFATRPISSRCEFAGPVLRHLQPAVRRQAALDRRDAVAARSRLLVRASQGGEPDKQPRARSLVRRYVGLEYTFVLAGFLKILTFFACASLAPNELTRTAVGQVSPYLMVPVGLGLCWVAKKIVDADLHENPRFMTFMGFVLVVVYFGLAKVLYRGNYSDLIFPARGVRPRDQMTAAQQLGMDNAFPAGVLEDERYSNYPQPAPRTSAYSDLVAFKGERPPYRPARGVQGVTEDVDSDALDARGAVSEDFAGLAPGGAVGDFVARSGVNPRSGLGPRGY